MLSTIPSKKIENFLGGLSLILIGSHFVKAFINGELLAKRTKEEISTIEKFIGIQD